jgi:hypothetical protein
VKTFGLITFFVYRQYTKFNGTHSFIEILTSHKINKCFSFYGPQSLFVVTLEFNENSIRGLSRSQLHESKIQFRESSRRAPAAANSIAARAVILTSIICINGRAGVRNARSHINGAILPQKERPCPAHTHTHTQRSPSPATPH